MRNDFDNIINKNFTIKKYFLTFKAYNANPIRVSYNMSAK